MSQYSSLKNWRGCRDIQMGYYDDYADPDLIYNGYTFNYWDIEGTLWDMFEEDTGFPRGDDQAFNEYVQNHAAEHLDEVIEGNYFLEGSKSWHDMYKKH